MSHSAAMAWACAWSMASVKSSTCSTRQSIWSPSRLGKICRIVSVWSSSMDPPASVSSASVAGVVASAVVTSVVASVAVVVSGLSSSSSPQPANSATAGWWRCTGAA